ncbi:MAG: hypothetical protein M0P74_11710, partial [Syntrophales bacterium]|nr:hypothetical protein [Syntrophales bacterium]
MRTKHNLIVVLCILASIFTSSFPVFASETYKFERAWPTIQQPWYFSPPFHIAVDDKGYVYVVNRSAGRIFKFNANGQIITKFGSSGAGNGQFTNPYAIAADEDGNIYVTDYGACRIQKFSSSGEYLASWGSSGTASGQFTRPTGIATDGSGFVYVLDSGSNHIQKFTTGGTFVLQWGAPGVGNGEFNLNNAEKNTFGSGIAADATGNVYVADFGNHRIQVFSEEGVYLRQWGAAGEAAGQFGNPDGIALDREGNVYVADSNLLPRIQKFKTDGTFVDVWSSSFIVEPTGIAVDPGGKVYITDFSQILSFTTEGVLLTTWSSAGTGDGQLTLPEGITADTTGNIFVADTENHRIQKFSPEGQALSKWGSAGDGNGQFHFPADVVQDGQGYLYALDSTNNRIQKFDADGNYITAWGSYGTGNGQFASPKGMAIDTAGNIYVADTDNYRIQKFAPPSDNQAGSPHQFFASYGGAGTQDGQFNLPYDVAIDGSGNIYIADSFNHRIQKFGSGGAFVNKWGSQGSAPGQFAGPRGITIDGDGNLLIADTGNNRIQKFAADGQFIAAFGASGTGAGQFTDPWGIAVALNGKVYVTENKNNRVQVFAPVTQIDNTKAIIVAGSGPFPGNDLWDATQMAANLAYRSLNNQGFTKETIYYLSANIRLDLDDNGVADDVNADATRANLQDAITRWATDADNVIVYLTGHGGDKSFRIGAKEIVSATELDTWLNQLQNVIPGKVIVILDTCESGSFVSPLAVPPAGKERIVITSTSPGESAAFISQGAISFSNYFWGYIFNGYNLSDAFTMSRNAINFTASQQLPLLEANGNGIGSEDGDFAQIQTVAIGGGIRLAGNTPTIGSVSPDRTISATNIATFTAENVVDPDGIARVWAVVRPPNYTQNASLAAVDNLPAFDLLPVGSNRYEATYNGFTSLGTYHVAIYARDRLGNTTIPVLTTLSVTNPLTRKAIIVAGGGTGDPLWSAYQQNAQLAYVALTYQGYGSEDIYYLSSTMTEGVDGTPTAANLANAITNWAKTNTQDLTLYLIGSGDNGTFKLSGAETLPVATLDGWLDDLQQSIAGEVTIIYDGSNSGSFVGSLAAPAGKKRISIASSNASELAAFLSDGDISFSGFFWSQVLSGATLQQAFVYAKKAIVFSSKSQTPLLDADANGVANQKTDGAIASAYSIGAGIMFAGDEPYIDSVSPEQALNGRTSVTIWADGIATTGILDTVIAVVTPPAGSSPNQPYTITLTSVGNGRYEGTIEGFTAYGEYEIAIFAKDKKGNLSLHKKTKIHHNTETQVSGGELIENTIWSVSQSPYHLLGNLIVPTGLTLTIEPGVTIKIDSGKAIQVDGTLIARGTSENKIIFTSSQATPVAGSWGFIKFTNSSIDATFDDSGNYTGGSILQHCKIEYAGGGSVPDAVIVESAAPFIDNCEIAYTKSAGIYATNPPNIRITNNNIHHSQKIGNG